MSEASIREREHIDLTEHARRFKIVSNMNLPRMRRELHTLFKLRRGRRRILGCLSRIRLRVILGRRRLLLLLAWATTFTGQVGAFSAFGHTLTLMN